MSNFFEAMEAQRRRDLGDVAIGAAIGVLAVAAVIGFAIEPSSLTDYIPALGAAIPGACLAAGIIEHQDHEF
jgi:hypothetical protein